MIEDQEKLIKKYQEKRKLKKIKYGVTSICLIIISLVFIMIYTNLEKSTYISSEENADVNYKINLKENDFYPNDYVEEGIDIIATLIKNIETHFKYSLNLSEETDYTYNYKITGKLEVLRSNNNVVFTREEELLTKGWQASNSKNLSIDETLNIDYEEYNDKINNFVRTYSLSNMTNRLVLTMYVYVNNSYDGTQINKESQVMTIEIPLTTQTVDIGITTNATQNKGQVLINKKECQYSKYVLALGIIILILGMLELIRLVKYVLDVRSAETMYEQTLKNIMISYKSYIQKINRNVRENDFDTLEVESFAELVNMRDVINSPILMLEEGKYRTKFMLINENRIFEYILDANIIRENLREKSKNKNTKDNKMENGEDNNAQ